jgi:hypothetical protein
MQDHGGPVAPNLDWHSVLEVRAQHQVRFCGKRGGDDAGRAVVNRDRDVVPTNAQLIPYTLREPVERRHHEEYSHGYLHCSMGTACPQMWAVPYEIDDKR